MGDLVGQALNREQKKHNHDLGSKRILIEHVIRRLKIFRLLANDIEIEEGDWV